MPRKSKEFGGFAERRGYMAKKVEDEVSLTSEEGWCAMKEGKLLFA